MMSVTVWQLLIVNTVAGREKRNIQFTTRWIPNLTTWLRCAFQLVVDQQVDTSVLLLVHLQGSS